MYVETVLTNSSFCILLTSTLAYWGEAAFGDLTKYKLQSVARISMIFANLCLFVGFIWRWVEAGHIPLSNLYESFLFLAWLLTIFHLSMESKSNIFAIGIITAPMALFVDAFATLSLPPELQQIAPLVPALRSNWLLMHVTVMIISYAALLSGSLLAIALLMLGTQMTPAKQALVETIDSLSYRTLGIGFPFLTIGIISGAVWANEAWGSYWSWDPKETWALITWLIFAIYLHVRISRGWKGREAAWVAALGFLMVWICYVGVNLLGQGLHSYGWFK